MDINGNTKINKMINGNIKSEKQYRMINLDSSSSLKEFSLDRRKYYKKYFLNERIEEESNQASKIGSLVDLLLFEPEKFDAKFYLSSTAKPLTGKMADFVNALVDITIANTDEAGNVNKSFEDMATEARIIAQFDWKLPVILDKFIGKDPELLYKEMREVKSKGLTIITLQDVQNSERIVEDLKSNEFTAPIINLVNSDRYSVYNQFQIEDFEIDGLKLKGMMDKLIIDHKKKTISCYDLKCTFSVEGFYTEYYLFRRSYIQAYLYMEACTELKEREGLEYYTIECPKFIVCDSIGYYAPLIYTLNSDDMDDAYNGFEYKGRKYPGVKSIIEELKWAKENDKWNISKKNYENGGFVNIKG